MKYGTLIVIALALTLGLLACANLSSPETLVEYRRSGGLAGLDDHLTVKTDGKTILTRKTGRQEFVVNRDVRNQLTTLLDNTDFSELQKEQSPSRRGADFIEYAVTYKDQTVRTVDTAVPPQLQPIVRLLNQIIETEGKL